MRRIWKDFKNKNFVIVGIADDDGMEKKWKEAIKKDKIDSWTNILRGSGTKQDLTQFYSVREIPVQILIDPQGMIVGRYDGNNEKDLYKALLQIIK